MKPAKCPGCKQYQLLHAEEDLCLPCLRRREREAKAQREAERQAARRPASPLPPPAPARDPRPVPAASPSARPAPPLVEARPAASSPDHPLFGPAWEASRDFTRASASARHQLLTELRRVRDSGEWVRLEQLRTELQSRSDESPRAAADLLRVAGRYRGEGLPRVYDFVQATLAYADYRDTLRRPLPEVRISPARDGRLTEQWYLEGAWDLAETLQSLEIGPVRQVLLYLRGLPAGGSERGWKAAMLLPLAAASAARGVKAGRRTEDARLALLELARWAAETSQQDAEALDRAVLPAVQSVVAYHGLLREREGFLRRNRDAREIDPPPGYLEEGYFTPAGAPRERLFGEDAAAWAVKLDTDQVTTGQVRRFFHELRRLEALADTLPWEELRGRLLDQLPLAADAVARGLKTRSDFRALGALITLNVRQLVTLPEERQKDAFLRGMLPHLEAVLGCFNARTLGRPPAPGSLRGDATALADDEARQAAVALRTGKVSPTLVRHVYAHCRRLEQCDVDTLPAEVARAVVMTDDLLRRSGGTAEGIGAMRRLVRSARGANPKEVRERFLPYFGNVVAWFVGLPNDELG